MADSKDEIYRLIPHRPPFLWVDRIISRAADSIETETDIPVDLDIFAGHYPGRPLVPGVILCESVFQSGALLISAMSGEELAGSDRVPVLTRIITAKFKRAVVPGDQLNILVKLKEKVGPAWFMKGRLAVSGKTAVSVEFACTMAGSE